MTCNVIGCKNKQYARGYCQKHYMKLRRYGSAEAGREGHGMSGTPIYRRWAHIKKFFPYCHEWENFSVFHKDVGDPPSEGSTLLRLNENKPYSKNNVYWKSR